MELLNEGAAAACMTREQFPDLFARNAYRIA
jgi:hypothetical protein